MALGCLSRRLAGPARAPALRAVLTRSLAHDFGCLAGRSLSSRLFCSPLSLPRCCLAPGDSALSHCPWPPVAEASLRLVGWRFDRNWKPVLQSRHRVRCAVVHKVLTPDDV